MAARRRQLARSLGLPDVRSFDALFDRWIEWNDLLAPAPIAGVEVPATDYTRSGRPIRTVMTIGPFLSVKPGRSVFAIEPSRLTLEAITSGTVSIPYDTISFATIVWDPTAALVVATHAKIIGSVWLAVVEPATVPGWLPPGRSRDVLVYARQEDSSDAYAVTADVIEEDGGADFELSAEIVRTYAKELRRLERRRASARRRAAQRARKSR